MSRIILLVVVALGSVFFVPLGTLQAMQLSSPSKAMGAAVVRTSAVPSTRVYVKTVPQGASIRINEVEHGKSDQLITLPKNLIPQGATSVELTVKVWLDNRRSQNQRVTITRGRIKRVEFRFGEKADAPAKPGVEAEESGSQDSQTALPKYLSPSLPPMLEEEEALAIVKEEGKFHVSVLTGRSLPSSKSIKRIIPDPDGGFLFLYARRSILQGGSVYYLAHYNTSGVLDWKIENLGNNQNDKDLRACLRTNEGNYLLVGNEYKPTAEKNPIGHLRSFAILVSSQGKIIPWKEDPFKNRNLYMVSSATISPEGHFLFAGTKNLASHFFCTNAAGKMLWEKTFDQANQPIMVSPCKGGGYFASGYLLRQESKKDAYTLGSTWLCRFKEDGTLLWDTILNDERDLYVPKVVQTSDGFLTLIHVKGKEGGSKPLYNWHLVHVDSVGNRKTRPIQQVNFDLDSYSFIYTPEENLLSIACKQKHVMGEPQKIGLLHVDSRTGKRLGVSLLGSPGQIRSITPLGDKQYFVISSYISPFLAPTGQGHTFCVTIRIDPKKEKTKAGPTRIELTILPPTPEIALSASPSITTVWEKKLTLPFLEEIKRVVADPDGGFLVIHNGRSELTQKPTVCFIHYNAEGKVTWRTGKALDVPNYMEIVSCLRTHDGNYLCFGGKVDELPNGIEYLAKARPAITLISPQGKFLSWENNPFEGGENPTKMWAGHAIASAITCKNGDFLFGGLKYVPAKEKELPCGMWLCRVTSQGKVLWKKDFNAARGFVPLALRVCPEGGYYAMCRKTIDDRPKGPIQNSNLIYRFGEKGELLWELNLPFMFSSIVAQDTQGEIFTLFHGVSMTDFDQPTFQMKIVKVNAAGEKEVLPVTPNKTAFCEKTERSPEPWVLTPSGRVLTVGLLKKKPVDKKNPSQAVESLFIVDSKTGKFLGSALDGKLRKFKSITSLGNGEYLVVSDQEARYEVIPKYRDATLTKIRFGEEEIPNIKEAIKTLETTNLPTFPWIEKFTSRIHSSSLRTSVASTSRILEKSISPRTEGR